DFELELAPRQARVFVVGEPLHPSRPAVAAPPELADATDVEVIGGGDGCVASLEAVCDGKRAAGGRLTRVLRGIRGPLRRREKPLASMPS
ncbi:MAG TPA: hypothetical protein VKH36_15525, partial [Acidimicrobiia bacterium]|nr:hypothetical protein [Acidimicrobiia bacterium]